MQFFIQLQYKDQPEFSTHITTTSTNARQAKFGVLEWAEQIAERDGRIGKPTKRKATRI